MASKDVVILWCRGMCIFDIVEIFDIYFDIGDSKMSDGPYKSLKMTAPWREVAMRAHKASFSDEEREQSMCVALRKDVLRNVGSDYINAIGNILLDQQQGNLFADQAAIEIDKITSHYSQATLRDTMSANIQAALHSGKSGEEALVKGVNLTLQDYGRGCARQVEEHYKRDARTHTEREKTVSVRDIMTRTLSSAAIGNLGQEIVGYVRGEALQTRLVKSSGLEDGPRF